MNEIEEYAQRAHQLSKNYPKGSDEEWESLRQTWEAFSEDQKMQAVRKIYENNMRRILGGEA